MSRSKLRKILIILLVASTVLSAGLGLIELWFDVFSPSVIVKLFITFGVVFVVSGLLLAIISDMDDETGDKKDKLLG